MQKVWIYLSLAALCVFPSREGQAHDWLRHFETKALTYVPKPDGLPDHLKLYPSEWYLVQDNSTNRQFALLTGIEINLVGMLAAHELAEIVGLKHFPIWPTLVRRGVNFPQLTAEGNIAINPSYSTPSDKTPVPIATVLPQGHWGLALLMPVTGSQSYAMAARPREMVLDQILQFAFCVAIGAEWIDSRHWENRSYLFNVVDTLRHINRKTTQRAFNELMKPIGWKELGAYSPEDAAWMVDEISRFFDLLDTAGTTHSRTIFESYLNYEATRPEGRRFDVNVLYRLPKRFKEVRELTQTYLRERIGGNFRTATLTSRPLPSQTLIAPKQGKLNQPGSDIFKDVPALRRMSRHYLEAFATTPPLRRMELIEEWTAQLNGIDPIKTLMDIAVVWDGSVRLTKTRTASLPGQDSSSPLFPQSFLNRTLPKTLVVYSINDREGEAIHELLNELSPVLPIIPHAFELERGRLLFSEDFQSFVDLAKREGAQRIMIVECGGFTDDDKALMERQGLDVVQVDHHRDKNRSSWHRYSALEQLADLLGYDLNADQHIVGLMDRAGVRGLLQMGWNRAQIEAYLAPREGTRRMNAIRRSFAGAFDTDHEVVVSITDYDAPMGSLSHALAIESFPRIPTLLVERPHSLIFSGPPEVVESVLDNTPDHSRHVVWGGDYSSNLYAVIHPRGSSVRHLASDVMNVLEGGTVITNPCIIQILGHDL